MSTDTRGGDVKPPKKTDTSVENQVKSHANRLAELERLYGTLSDKSREGEITTDSALSRPRKPQGAGKPALLEHEQLRTQNSRLQRLYEDLQERQRNTDERIEFVDEAWRKELRAITTRLNETPDTPGLAKENYSSLLQCQASVKRLEAKLNSYLANSISPKELEVRESEVEVAKEKLRQEKRLQGVNSGSTLISVALITFAIVVAIVYSSLLIINGHITKDDALAYAIIVTAVFTVGAFLLRLINWIKGKDD